MIIIFGVIEIIKSSHLHPRVSGVKPPHRFEDDLQTTEALLQTFFDDPRSRFFSAKVQNSILADEQVLDSRSRQRRKVSKTMFNDFLLIVMIFLSFTPDLFSFFFFF